MVGKLIKLLGGNVIGFSLDVPTSPSQYELIKNSLFKDYFFDITDLKMISKVINEFKPEFIFHLAAQPIVIESYNNPPTTFKTNVLGTANILEALRISNHKCTTIMITSDTKAMIMLNGSMIQGIR